MPRAVRHSIEYDLVRELFDYRDGELFWKRSGDRTITDGRAGFMRANGYRAVQINGKRHLIHRLIYLWHHGSLPEEIDHIDRDPQNNRIENLRPATRGLQMRNTKAKGYSQKQDGRWIVRIQRDHVYHYIGTFATEEEAREARAVAKRVYHSEE